jgi:(p)ppGpp synthase/HD superfamily hydrolase
MEQGKVPMPEFDDGIVTDMDAATQRARAQAIASIAHRGQVDKLGAAYLDHPARVADQFDRNAQPLQHCAAWLHDVVEDSDITEQDLLNAGVLPAIVEAVGLLTRRDDVPDALYYERISWHPIARAVKLADIADNTAEWRTRGLDHDTRARLSQKYARARAYLLAHGSAADSQDDFQ